MTAHKRQMVIRMLRDRCSLSAVARMLLSLPMENVDYIGVSPQQIVGISAALVPFLEHEDANRALMGANHQRQAVPLIRPEAPLVGTGMEGPAARYSGALITAKRAGTVTSVSADEILIYTGQALHHDEGENTFSEMGVRCL